METSGQPERGNIDVKLDGDPRKITNLSVWRDVQSLERFVWGTVHRQFYERRKNWFEVLDKMHFAMWWVPEGHRPSLDEALERLQQRQEQGDSSEAFGWEYLCEAKLWREHRCA